MTDRIATIGEFMTKSPFTIEAGTPLAEARTRMFRARTRHLPVTRDGRLVGILSDRDVERCEAAMVGAPRGRWLSVDDALTERPFTCGPHAHLHAVADEMASHKYGSAVVVDPERPTHVLGVFTTIDALRALAVFAPQE
jgi:acetoin utilization protein AcuB